MNSRPLAAATLALIALITTATVALGHAELLASDPPDGGTLTTTPYKMTVTFDEPLGETSSLVVRDADGVQVAAGGRTDELASVMTAELPALTDGKYVVFWTAVTPDDQAVERGSYAFTIAAAGASPAATSAGPSPGASPISGGDGSPTGNNNDLLIALLVAALVIAGVVGFLLVRGRR